MSTTHFRTILTLITVTQVLSLPAVACTIIMATDGESVVVGNNEDFRHSVVPQYWIDPATEEELGVMFWGFDYMEYEAERNPQGGLNEAGLFFDGTSVPACELAPDPARRDVDDTFVIEVMRRCATVDEVVELVSGMNLVGFERSQIVFVDAAGDWLVLEINEMTRKAPGENNLVVGNFRHSRPEMGGFPSREHTTASRMLGRDAAPTVTNLTAICDAVHDAGTEASTIYSTVADLRRREIHLYQFHDYEHQHVIRLDDELARGYHKVNLADLFPRRAGPEVLAVIAEQGDKQGLAHLCSLLDDRAYNCGESELAYIAASLVTAGRLETSLAVSDLIIERHPHSANAHLEKGRTYLYSHDRESALACFAAARELDPDDTDIAWMHETTSHPARRGNTKFLLPGHSDAGLVTVRFQHEGYTDLRHIMSRKDDHWVYHVDLDDGTYVYAFCVDGEFYPDPADTSGAFPSILIKD